MVYRLFVLKFRKILIKIFCGSDHLIRFQVFKLQHYQKDTQQRLFFWRFSEMFRISTIKIKPTNCSFSKNTFDKSYEILILMKENISTNNCRQIFLKYFQKTSGSTHGQIYSDILCLSMSCPSNRLDGDHSFSKFTKFPEKLTFFTPICTRTYSYCFLIG